MTSFEDAKKIIDYANENEVPVHIHIGGGSTGGGSTPPPDGDPTDPPAPPDPTNPVIYGKGNEIKSRLKLWTPYNHNGVIQKNAKGKLIMLEASNVESGAQLAIQNSDEFIIVDEVNDADSGGNHSAYFRITKFRKLPDGGEFKYHEDKLAADHLREPGKVPYEDIKPIFYVPKLWVELVEK